MANVMWHHDRVTLEDAMTELLAALSDASPDADTRRAARVAAALYETSRADQSWGWQKRLAVKTGLSRETIRCHIEDERIRRGEIDPTERYLKEQARKAAPKKRSTVNG